ncbi:3-phosphoglycerate kinase [Arthrobacter sp. 2762]
MQPVLIEGGKGIVQLREDGVIHLIWQHECVLEAADIKAAMATINELCAGDSHPMLVDMAHLDTVSHDARAAFSLPCAASRIALVGATPVDRVIATFRAEDSYPCPTRFFTDRTQALNWLLQAPAS